MKKHFIFTIIFIAYCALLFKVMVLRQLPTVRVGHIILRFGGADANGQANFVPFKMIGQYLLGRWGGLIAVLELLGNIAVLIPFGFLLPFVFRNMTWKKSLAFAILTPLIIEILQAVLHLGIFDIDDVILNGLGVLLGFGVYKIFEKIIAIRMEKMGGK